MPDTCTCKFTQPGVPMDSSSCEVHTEPSYSCDDCSCLDYSPRREPTKRADGSIAWPLCICGHVAQAHN